MCNIMKVNKTAIVYHKSDLDGVVSAAITRELSKIVRHGGS